MSDDKQKALRAIEGLTFSDVTNFFYEKASDREKAIAAMVKTKDGDTECDGAILSEGDDNGAYVLTWRWVDFAGTPFSKICADCDEPTVKVIKERDGTEKCLCSDCLEQITCPDCGAVEGTDEWGTVGDGFDGYCPSCADKREASGEVEKG